MAPKDSEASPSPAGSRRFLRLSQPAIVLTVPKSGTHLIANILREVFGATQVPPMLTADEVPSGLATKRAVYHAHFGYSLEASVALRRVRKVLQVRDPRDVAASYARSIYQRKITPDPVQTFLLQNNFGHDEILSFLLQGGSVGDSTYADFGSLYRSHYSAWRVTTDITLRYEDLLPDGDDFSGPTRVVRRLLERLEVSVPDGFPLEERVRRGSEPERSPTFDRGRAGSWHTDFAPLHHELLNSVAPGLLAELGYEIVSPLPLPPVKTTPADAAQTGVDAVARRELARVEGLLTRIKSFDDYVPQRACVVNYSAFNLWLVVWVDDAAQRSDFLQPARNGQIEALRTRSPAPVAYLPPGAWAPSVEVCKAALAQYRSVHFVDVGCCYGLETMLVTARLRSFQERLSITAFDCGWAGRLAPAGFDINGLASAIRFRDEAVSAWDAMTLVFGSYGHMENMRIVNNDVAQDTLAYPVHGIRLDTAFADLPEDIKLVVKLHIQGAEFLALRGAERLFESGRIAAVIVCFAPHALETTDRPQSLLRYVPAGWHILDVGADHWATSRPAQAVLPDRFDQLVRDVSDSGPGYTFLVLHDPGFDLSQLQNIALLETGSEARGPEPDVPSESEAASADPQALPSAKRLQSMTDSGRYADAVALLRRFDLTAGFDAEFLYYAGVCFGSVGEEAAGIDLLKRAADAGFVAFWCAYHLGLFEMRRGRPAAAAYYFTISLIFDPDRQDIYPLLAEAAPGIELDMLRRLQAGERSPAAADAALERAAGNAEADHLGATAYFSTIALLLDPQRLDARERLLAVAPDVLLSLMPEL